MKVNKRNVKFNSFLRVCFVVLTVISVAVGMSLTSYAIIKPDIVIGEADAPYALAFSYKWKNVKPGLSKADGITFDLNGRWKSSYPTTFYSQLPSNLRNSVNTTELYEKGLDSLGNEVDYYLPYNTEITFNDTLTDSDVDIEYSFYFTYGEKMYNRIYVASSDSEYYFGRLGALPGTVMDSAAPDEIPLGATITTGTSGQQYQYVSAEFYNWLLENTNLGNTVKSFSSMNFTTSFVCEWDLSDLNLFISLPENYELKAGGQMEFWIRLNEFTVYRPDSNGVYNQLVYDATHFDYGVSRGSSASDQTFNFNPVSLRLNNEWMCFRSSVNTSGVTTYITGINMLLPQGANKYINGPYLLTVDFDISPILFGVGDTLSAYVPSSPVDPEQAYRDEVVGKLDEIISGSTIPDPDIPDPDYDSITGDPNYDVAGKVDEAAKIQQVAALNNDVGSLLDSDGFTEAGEFWQQVYNLILSLPVVVGMVSIFCIILVMRTLTGR